jgi:hypothetical protein
MAKAFVSSCDYYQQELAYDLDDAEEFLQQRLGIIPLVDRKDWAIRLTPLSTVANHNANAM